MSSRPARTYTTHDTAIDAQIAQLLSSVKDDFDRRLLTELIISIYRLGQDGATTGDLKLINAAVKELRYAFKIFRPYRHRRKVATFGSARVSTAHPAYPMAKEFGRLMVKANWMVITGAASGIMQAGHEGAGHAASFGLNIRLPFEQEANVVIAKDPKLINCKYFFTRKLLFIKESHATVLFPGGFGTLDEGFESLTLAQTGKSDPRPVVFVDTPKGAFWDPLLKFFRKPLMSEGMISPADEAIYQVARSAQEAVDHIVRFYRIYHSIRYIGELLVIRLNQRLSPGGLAQLNREFSEVLTSGAIEQRAALPEETDEPALKALPRLVLQFNRQNYGRLHALIHRLNDLSAALALPSKRASGR
jgi:uncharacterized protein (TIGR00730 family)